jgi:hypothetical protein
MGEARREGAGSKPDPWLAAREHVAAALTDANGNPVTVYVDAGFNFVSVESGP